MTTTTMPTATSDLVVPGITPGADPNDPRWAALAAPFPQDQVELLPKPIKRDSPKGQCTRPDRNGITCGGYHGLPAIHLHYVGHAGVTMRLNSVDPTWDWEPLNRLVDPEMLKLAITSGNPEMLRTYLRSCPPQIVQGTLWIRLKVLGIWRIAFGDADGKSGASAVKEIIGDAIRNGAMRFGVGTYLWSKSDAAIALAMREEGATPDGEPARPAQHREQRPARQQRADERQRPAQQQPADPAPDPAVAGPEPDMPKAETLSEFVRLVLDSHDPRVLRRMAAGLGPRRAKAAAAAAIPTAIGEVGVRTGLLPTDANKVTLAVFVEACAKHLEQQGGMSMADAARAGAST